MSKIISIFFEIYYMAVQGFALQYFLGHFLEYRGGEKRGKGFLTAAIYTVCGLCIARLLPYGYEDIRLVEKQAAMFGMIVILALLFYQVGKRITGYLLVTFMMVSHISFFISYSVLLLGGNLYSVWVWCLEKGHMSADHTMILINATTVLLQILMYGFFTILCVGSLKKIIQSFREKEYPINRTELYFLLAPSMAGFLICILLRMFMVTVEDGVPTLLYTRHPALTVVVPAILVLCLLSVVYSVKLFQDMISLNRERNSRIILEQQIGSMQGQIAELEHIYSGVRSMKHDMGNTLAVIMRLAGQGGENEELKAYLSELNQTFDRLEMQYKTGNAVVDTLLNMKYHELLRTVPEAKLYAEKLIFPDNLVIRSYDIGVIIGNALDNAVEACKNGKGGDREPFIRLTSFSKGKLFFLKVENSFDGNVVRKKGAELPATTKPDKKAHGIGLANIKNTAEKYHGGVDWQAENRVFTLLVMMKNEQAV